ncbi:MAG: phospholipid carrier-dependent glycosyltransferase [Deltaproteobacteria bacterium]|nr:MAG: phospholipid carrier-dependent glycosyltransferase [Deltaproteobacteria bacterium]
MSDERARTAWTVVAVLSVVLCGFRAWFASAVELSPDEAYYWAWSLRPSMGYYDHGPAVAWLIRAGVAIVGRTELGVRLGALLCSALTSAIVFVIARRLAGSWKVALWVFVLVQASPIFATGAVVHTPDAWLALCWACAAYFGLRAVQEHRIGFWLGFGVASGAAMYAKLSGLLLLAGLALFLVGCRRGHRLLKESGPVLAFLAAAFVAVPHIAWNAHRQGGSFAFQLARLAGGLSFRPLGPIEFAAGQAAVVGPLTFIAAAVFAFVAPRADTRRTRADIFLMWCLAMPLMGICLLLSVFRKIEANWPAMSYLTLLPAAGWAWHGGYFYSRRQAAWNTSALALAALLTLVAHVQALSAPLPLAPGVDPTRRLRGWRDLAAVAVERAGIWGSELAAEGYGLTSELSFYTGREVLYQPSADRKSQYDLWPQRPVPDSLIVVMSGRTRRRPEICADHLEQRLMQVSSSPDDGQGRAKEYNWWLCRRRKQG